MGNGIITDRNQLPSTAKEFAFTHDLSSVEIERFQLLYSTALAEKQQSLSDEMLLEQVCKQLLIERRVNRALFPQSPGKDESQKVVGRKVRSESTDQSAEKLNIRSSEKRNGNRTKSFDPEGTCDRLPLSLGMGLLTNISRSLQNIVPIGGFDNDEASISARGAKPTSRGCSPISIPRIGSTGQAQHSARASDLVIEVPVNNGYVNSQPASPATHLSSSANPQASAVVLKALIDPACIDPVPIYRTFSNGSDTDNETSITSNSFKRSVSSNRSRGRRPSLGDDPRTWKASIMLTDLKEKSKLLHQHFSSTGQERSFTGAVDPSFWCDRDKFVMTGVGSGEFIRVYFNGLMGPPGIEEVVEMVVVDTFGEVLQKMFLPVSTIAGLAKATDSLPADSALKCCPLSKGGDGDVYSGSGTQPRFDVNNELCRDIIANFCCDHLRVCSPPRSSMFEIRL